MRRDRHGIRLSALGGRANAPQPAKKNDRAFLRV